MDKEQIIKQLEPIIKAKSMRSFVMGLEADDIAQELRIKLWQHLDDYNPQMSKLQTFAINIMNNCIKDLIRASYREKRLALNIAEPLDENIIDPKSLENMHGV